MFDLMYCGINVLATHLLFKYSELLWSKKGVRYLFIMMKLI